MSCAVGFGRIDKPLKPPKTSLMTPVLALIEYKYPVEPAEALVDNINVLAVGQKAFTSVNGVLKICFEPLPSKLEMNPTPFPLTFSTVKTWLPFGDTAIEIIFPGKYVPRST